MKAFLIILVIAVVVAGVAMYVRASKQEAAEARTLKSLPPSVQNVVGKMGPNEQAAFFNEYDIKKKKVSVSYLLWILFGFHYLYNRKVGLQFAYWFTLGGVLIWVIADLFRMPSIVRSANEAVAREALQTLSFGAQFNNAAMGQGFVSGAVAVPTIHPAMVPPQGGAVIPAQAGQWAADPYRRYELRFYDGTQWTAHVMRDGVQGVDVVSQ